MPETIIDKNYTLVGAAGRPTAFTIFYRPDQKKKPLLIFLHGFKGFKDWGCFPLAARVLAQRGGFIVTFNFSHNGVTLQAPQEFADLEAFGNNNYSKELEDVEKLLQELRQIASPEEVDWDTTCIVGHSRGGGLALLAALEFPILHKAVAWAGVSRLGFEHLPQKEIEAWRQSGIRYILNARTGQAMPLYYQLYEDYMQNRARFNLQERLKNLQIPVLLIHGSLDESVPFAHAKSLKSWLPQATLLPIEGGDHTFGATHPFTGQELPPLFQQAVEATAQFCFGQRSTFLNQD